MSKLIITGSSVLVFLLAGAGVVSAKAPTLSSQWQYLTETFPESDQELVNNHLNEYAYTDAVPVLKVGSTGEAVEDVQRFLKQVGAYTGEIDGIFGSQSKVAVVRFQQQAKLTPDGIVGFQTWRAMVSSQLGV